LENENGKLNTASKVAKKSFDVPVRAFGHLLTKVVKFTETQKKWHNVHTCSNEQGRFYNRIRSVTGLWSPASPRLAKEKVRAGNELMGAYGKMFRHDFAKNFEQVVVPNVVGGSEYILKKGFEAGKQLAKASRGVGKVGAKVGEVGAKGFESAELFYAECLEGFDKVIAEW